MTLASFVIAPLFEHIDGIFSFQQHVNTVLSLPLVSIFFVGIATSLPDAFAAKVGFAVGVVAIAAGLFVPEQYLHFFHVYFVAFVLAVSSVFIATYIPCLRRMCGQIGRPISYVQRTDKAVVDLARWRPTYRLVAGLMVVLATLIISLQIGSKELFYSFWALWLAVLSTLLFWTAASTPAQKKADLGRQAKEMPKNPMEADDTVVGAEYIEGVVEQQNLYPVDKHFLLHGRTGRNPSNTISKVAACLVATLGIASAIARIKAQHARDHFFSVLAPCILLNRSILAIDTLAQSTLLPLVIPQRQRRLQEAQPETLDAAVWQAPAADAREISRWKLSRQWQVNRLPFQCDPLDRVYVISARGEEGRERRKKLKKDLREHLRMKYGLPGDAKCFHSYVVSLPGALFLAKANRPLKAAPGDMIDYLKDCS
eukprot:s301_g27.t1